MRIININFLLFIASFIFSIGVGCIYSGYIAQQMPFNHYWEYIGNDGNLIRFGIYVTVISFILVLWIFTKLYYINRREKSAQQGDAPEPASPAR